MEVAGLGIAVFAVLGLFFIPESPRYLIAHEKYSKAFTVFKKIAKINGKKFTQIMFKLSQRKASEEEAERVFSNPTNWIGNSEFSQEV